MALDYEAFRLVPFGNQRDKHSIPCGQRLAQRSVLLFITTATQGGKALQHLGALRGQDARYPIQRNLLLVSVLQ
jgi:hypothetical protein